MVLYLVTETQPHTVYELVSSSESGLDREAYLSLPRWKKIFSIAANQEPMVLQVSWEFFSESSFFSLHQAFTAVSGRKNLVVFCNND